MDDENYFPGWDDDQSVSRDVRIERFSAYLRELDSFELAIRIAATNSILLKEMEVELDTLRKKLEPLKNIRDSVEQAFDWANEGLRIGQRSSEKLMAVLEKNIDRKSKLSSAGAKGAATRASKLTPLKNWAVEAGLKAKGNPSEKARFLMKKITPALASLSNDPERVMREAIRAAAKST